MEHVDVLDYDFAEVGGARCGQSLPETIPVVDNLDTWRIGLNHERYWLVVVTSGSDQNPVGVAGACGIELGAIEDPLSVDTR